MRPIALLPLPALVMACTSDAQHQAPPNAAGTTSLVLIREGDFEQSDSQMLLCPAVLIGAQHHDLHASADVQTAGGGIASVSPNDNKADALLRIVVTKTGPASSHVALYGIGSNGRLNNEAWQVIQNCVKS